MAVKTVVIDGIGPVSIYKRRNSRHIRLSVGVNGQAKVSLPTWAPYRAGINFARSKADWITAQLAKSKTRTLTDGQIIGRWHTLRFVPADALKPRTRLTESEIIIKYPKSKGLNDAAVQQAAEKACQRALRQQAENIVPERLKELAKIHGLKFTSIEIRHLKSRWGSCNQRRQIKVSLFTMKLPDELINYVLLHELTHTKHLNHSAKFWETLQLADPDAKAHRKALHGYQPTIS